MEDVPKTSPVHSKASKTFSCVRCFERKVRCDRQNPCGGCVRSKTECIFRVPAPPRRRKRRSADDSIQARLKHYEELLREKGIDPASSSPATSLSKTDSQTTPEDGDQCTKDQAESKAALNWAPGSAAGKLIVNQGRSRFIENKLWTTVSEELYHSQDAIPDSETEDELETPADEATDFVLGMTASPSQTAKLHPNPDHILKLWQIFIANVNPMMKIIHVPTIQHAIEDAITDIEHIPRSLEALMLAIYCAAILSMRDGECRATFGESRTILKARYQLGVRRALTRAHFMSSADIYILQALVTYLLLVRQEMDSRTLWTLSGVASRIAQGMGVHRDGKILGLDPFETEMRRRLWWQINLLDFKAAEMSGFGGFGTLNWWNTKAPSNVNDVDMWPGMTEQPVEHARPTEMIVCLLHCEMGAHWRRKLTEAGVVETDFHKAMHQWLLTKTIAEKDVFVDEYQATLEEKILRYCDPSVPLEMMALIAGRMMCKGVRFMSHHPRRYASPKDIPEEEREFLWNTSMAMIEGDNLCHSHRALQRFQWHIDSGFQWHSLIYVLGELTVRPTGEGKDDAWVQLEDIYKNHPNFLSESRKPLHLAIANLCLKAWRAREKAQAEAPQAIPWLETPHFIQELRRQREAKEAKVAEVKGSKAAQLNLVSQAEGMKLSMPQQLPTFSSASSSTNSIPTMEPQFQQPSKNHGFVDPTFSPDDFAVMDDMTMDWQRWDTLLNDFDAPVQQVAPTMNPAQLTFVGQYGQQGFSWPLPAHTHAQ